MKAGGVRDSGYIWADDSRWRIDTPENPHSILAFIIYRGWVGGKALDLRGAKLSVYQRGDKLKRHCEARLKAAQARIEKIALGRDGTPQGTSPFDAG